MIGKTTLPQMWWPLIRWTEFKGIDDSLGHMPSPWEGGHWEYLLLDEGCDYLTALGMDGWRRLR